MNPGFFRRHPHARLSLTALAIMPMLAALAALGFVFIGGLPGVTLTGDLMAMLAALPVVTFPPARTRLHG